MELMHKPFMEVVETCLNPYYNGRYSWRLYNVNKSAI